ncbi:Polyamine-modulated factor 1 [Plecturocebus cupreus]
MLEVNLQECDLPSLSNKIKCYSKDGFTSCLYEGLKRRQGLETWRFNFNMGEASSANLGGGCEQKRHEESSPESVPLGTTISRVKLLNTMVDTFLRKLVAAGSCQRFTDCYRRFYQLQPEMTQRIYDKFIPQLQTSIRRKSLKSKRRGTWKLF